MDITTLLSSPRTIAVVGLSDNPERPSYQVADYFLRNGFSILPVNPNITSVFNISSFQSFLDIPRDIRIDIVDIFRKPDDVPQVVREVINSGRAPVIWMQEGVFSNEAKELAESHSLEVIMNTCLMKTHKVLSKST